MLISRKNSICYYQLAVYKILVPLIVVKSLRAYICNMKTYWWILALIFVTACGKPQLEKRLVNTWEVQDIEVVINSSYAFYKDRPDYAPRKNVYGEGSFIFHDNGKLEAYFEYDKIGVDGIRKRDLEAFEANYRIDQFVQEFIIYSDSNITFFTDSVFRVEDLKPNKATFYWENITDTNEFGYEVGELFIFYLKKA